MSKCGICGEPMPPGEEMFNYHGLSGPCPAPPKPRAGFIIEAKERKDDEGLFWLDVSAKQKFHYSLGPFATEQERNRATNDLLEMLQSDSAALTDKGE